MKSLDQITANAEKAEVFDMPNVMVIGKAVRCGDGESGNPPALWSECDTKGIITTLCALPRIIPNHMLGWTGDCPEGCESYTYMLGVLVPIGTPVPEGLDYRVLSKVVVGKGLFGKDLYSAIEDIRVNGYEPNYGDNNGWNAELYIGGEPSDDNWSWLFPVKLIK